MFYTGILAFWLFGTFQDAFSNRLIIRGLRRILGDAQEQKLSIAPKILLRILTQLTATSDSGFWAAMLIGFYTFFRKSNLVPKSGKDFDLMKTLTRGDIFLCTWGPGYLCAVVKNNSVSGTPIAYSGHAVINGSPSVPWYLMPCASLRTSHFSFFLPLQLHLLSCIPAPVTPPR